MRVPQIVLDTNVLVSAQRSRRGASSLLVSLVGTGAFDVHLAVPLALEYEAVLSRQREEMGLTREDVEDVVDALCALAVPHSIYFLWRPYLHDAADEHVLELAVAVQCDYVVTYNVKDFVGAERFGIGVSVQFRMLSALLVILSDSEGSQCGRSARRHRYRRIGGPALRSFDKLRMTAT